MRDVQETGGTYPYKEGFLFSKSRRRRLRSGENEMSELKDGWQEKKDEKIMLILGNVGWSLFSLFFLPLPLPFFFSLLLLLPTRTQGLISLHPGSVPIEGPWQEGG
jgi:hypothetical protein